ncbi:MAG: Re/Si-specific NAD(P)(+) transhydrogenase subunit alpha [Acidobacteria bacterium]|nr:Re/Si-specific NAD(P)(+) transhydrogenase subunit alpha [Acidobacteriota bacterium]
MIGGVVRETHPGERRVALVPESVSRIHAKGVDFLIEAGAGAEAGFSDDAYREAGAEIAATAGDVLASADLVVRVQAPDATEIEASKAGAAVVGLLFPLTAEAMVQRLRSARLTAIALDRIPRVTLAQSMDVLSSQSTVAGYRAAVLAAYRLPQFFPLLMTAAGRIDPARILVLGAGVAGLQAIATAHRLGAVVEAYDVRAVVKEQVESLGATFVEVPAIEDAETEGGYAREVSEESQRRANEVIAERLRSTDACITTALIPGRPAPRLITAEMVEGMPHGSLIVDLAAEQGGNCELTKPGEEVNVNGVTILGPLNLASDLAADASRMFSRNAEKLVLYLLNDGELSFDFDNEIVKGCVVTHDGEIVDKQVAEALA